MLMTLKRLGALDWPTLRALLLDDGSTCAWTDYAGFHLAPASALPSGIPPTTHLWAWGPHLVRARLDVDRALVAVLTDPGAGPDQVNVTVRPGHPWTGADMQIGRSDTPLPAAAFQLLELTGASPATFVRGVEA